MTKSKKIGLGLGILSIVFGLGLAVKNNSVAKAETNPPANIPFNNMMGNASPEFYQQMSDLMRKNNINCPMLGRFGQNTQTNANAVNAGWGMMRGAGNGNARNFRNIMGGNGNGNYGGFGGMMGGGMMGGFGATRI